MHIPVLRPAAMGQKEADRPQLRPRVPATLADGVEYAQILLTLGCAENAGTQISNRLSGHVTDVPRIVLEVIAPTLSCQVNVVSLKFVNEDRDRDVLGGLVRLSLAVYLSTRSQPPGLP